MKVNARPHLNGNVPEDFEQAARKIFNAAHDFNVALSALDEVFHGRNYQHLSASHATYQRRRDLLIVAELRDAAQKAIQLATAVLDAGKEGI